MNDKALRIKTVVQIVLFLIFFAFTIAVNLNCSDNKPVKGPECGSGRNSWDAKSQNCRDLSNNQIVPNSCCGP